MASKRKRDDAPTDEEPVDPSDELMFFGLGGCNEVGRSSHIIQYKGKTIMLDAGMHTGTQADTAAHQTRVLMFDPRQNRFRCASFL